MAKATKTKRRSGGREDVGVAAGGAVAQRRKEKKELRVRKSRLRKRRPHRRRKERDHLVNGSLKVSVPAARVKIT